MPLIAHAEIKCNNINGGRGDALKMTKREHEVVGTDSRIAAGKKKPYTTPKLERYGSVAQLTERATGSTDATSGKNP